MDDQENHIYDNVRMSTGKYFYNPRQLGKNFSLSYYKNNLSLTSKTRSSSSYHHSKILSSYNDYLENIYRSNLRSQKSNQKKSFVFTLNSKKNQSSRIEMHNKSKNNHFNKNLNKTIRPFIKNKEKITNKELYTPKGLIYKDSDYWIHSGNRFIHNKVIPKALNCFKIGLKIVNSLRIP